MEYLKAFLVGGAICAVGQLLLDKTKLTPARILVCFVGRKTGGAGGRMARRAHRRTEGRSGRHLGGGVFRLSRGAALQAEG